MIIYKQKTEGIPVEYLDKSFNYMELLSNRDSIYAFLKNNKTIGFKYDNNFIEISLSNNDSFIMHIKNSDIDKFYESRKFSHIQKRFYSFIESIKELKKKQINNIYQLIPKYYLFTLLYLFIAFIIFVIINATILKIHIHALFFRGFFLWLSASFLGGILTGLIKKEICFYYHHWSEYASKEGDPVSYYFILFMCLILCVMSFCAYIIVSE